MKKVGRILFCFVPLLFALAIQFLVSIPPTAIAFLKSVIDAPVGSSFWKMYLDFANSLLDSNFNAIVSVIYSVSIVIIFGYWYQKKFRALDVKQLPSHFNPMLICGLVVLVPGLQYLTSYVANFTAAIHPQWLTDYETLMETAGLTDVSFIMSLYAVLIGPICEELIFRGVTLSYAKKEMPFWVANILQAFIFGVYHLNVIQGVYAFFIGLFFGYIYQKTQSIFPTMLLHILFNSWGLFAGEWFMYKADTPLFFIIWLLVGIILTVLGLIVVAKGSNKLISKTAAKVFTDSSDI